MSLDNAKNFAKVTVSTGYDAAATSIVLSSGNGAKLPTAPFNVIWYNSTDYSDPTDDPNVEICRVTLISTDTLTITRAQEGTSASTKNTAGKTYKMIAGLTAKVINTDIPGLAPSGIGWALKTYQTAAAATSILISSLDLATDLAYQVVVQMDNCTTDVTLRALVNDDATASKHTYLNDGARTESGSVDSAWADNGGDNAFWEVSHISERCIVAVMDFFPVKSGANIRPVAFWNLLGFGASAAQNNVVRYTGSGSYQGGTNMTSLRLQNNAATNADWKVWVYKRATS